MVVRPGKLSRCFFAKINGRRQISAEVVTARHIDVVE
jgi:hypothetical protein